MNEKTYSAVILAEEHSYTSIRAAVDTVLAQIERPAYILVLDVLSRDSEKSTGVQNDIAAYPEVHYLKIKYGKNAAEMRNAVLEEITTDYVVFMSANEEWDDKKIAKQIICLADSPECVSSCCCANHYTLGKYLQYKDGAKPDVSRWLEDSPLKTPGQMLYRTDALRKIGGFDEQMLLLGDTDALIRSLAFGNCAFVSENLVNFREREATLVYTRTRFFEYASLVKRVEYIDLLLSDKKVLWKYYRKTAALAWQAHMLPEAVTYSLIAFFRSPWLSVKRVSSLLLVSLKNFILRFGKRRQYRAWTRRFLSAVRNRKNTAVSFTKHQREQLVASTEAVDASLRRKIGFNAAVLQEKTPAPTIPAFAYLGSDFEGVLVIPAYVTEIGRGAFAGCHRLQGVVLPAHLKKIGDGAFADCTSLSSVRFLDNRVLVKIGDFAFAGCPLMESYSFPSTLTEIGKAAFARNTALQDACFCAAFKSARGTRILQHFYPKRVEGVADYCFADCTGLSDIKFERGSMMKRIGAYSFAGCRNLTQLWVDSHLETVGEHAFSGCEILKNIIISDMSGFTSIGKYAFSRCRALTETIKSPGFHVIARGTYEGCDRLVTVRVPANIRSVGNGAFADCAGLETLIVQNPYARVRRKACKAGVTVIQASKEDEQLQ